MTPRRPTTGRARHAMRAAHVAAIVTGAAVSLAAMGRPAEAVIAAAIAALLIIAALNWALRQEDNR